MVSDIQLQGVIDQSVFEGCLAGKRQSQALLYNYFAPKMFGICLRYASDYHSAEDILQEGFIKVFNNLYRFRGEGSFEGWLKRIFINTAIEYYRKSLNLKKNVELDKAPEPTYASTAIGRLATADLLKLVQKLPPGYRTVFNLYAIEGFAHREIGEMLGISEGTSKSQLARARETLKKMIKSEEE
ncbi:MAG: RNA polymerase sigma factor [Bacteroidota bacterium]